MKEDTGQILIVDKIVNNNIVIAKDFRGREVVAIGKGVGFRKRKNEAVHRSEIMKTYVLLDKVDSGVLTLFEEIQFEVIETSQKIIDYAQEKLNVKFNVNLLMSLSDHINFALIQYRQGNHVPKLVNEEVNRLATTCLRNTAIGTDNITDFLAVTYYAGNFEHKSALEYPIEIQDTYVRLDRNISELLEAAEKKVGIQNLLVFITSTGYADAEVSDYLSEYRIPAGEFYMDRCTALLNMFLMATYGQGQYVEAYNGLHVYLDQKLIEKKQLNFAEVMTKAAEFLAQFSGVKSVYTSQNLRLNAYSEEAMRMRNSYNGKSSGDIILAIAPGWKLMNEDVTKEYPYKIVRDSYLEFPLIFWGAGTKPELIHTPTTVDCIAPTLAHFMRIRAPNACSVAPLTDLNK